MDRFRARTGLLDEQSTLEWLDSFGLTLDQLTDFCRVELLKTTIRASFSSADVTRWFEEHQVGYAASLLSALSFATESEAWLAHQEFDKMGFDELAWTRAQADPTLPAGGHLGWVFNKDLPSDAADSVRACAPERCTAPLLVGSTLYLYFVWQHRSPRLTATLETRIRADLLDDALSRLQQDS